MLVRRRLFQFIALLLMIALVLAACERPIPGSDDIETVATEVVSEAAPDVDSSGEEPPTTEPEEEATPEPTKESEGETPRVEEEAAPTPEPTVTTEPEETDEAAAEAEEESEAEETTDEAADEEAAEAEEEAGEEATEEETAAEETSETPQTHTVAAGENLYLIGLKYGISWVTLAEYNNLGNANQIKVGQVLNIPGGDTPQTAEPTPSPLTETIYIVKPGDNLFRIGLAYGINWVQIAEANGIVNPNQIEVGQELKIPVDTPGPAPQFTHQVKAGETIFLISLRYGVPWTTIAEANDIGSPYVIYVGQTLVIPGD